MEDKGLKNQGIKGINDRLEHGIFWTRPFDFI